MNYGIFTDSVGTISTKHKIKNEYLKIFYKYEMSKIPITICTGLPFYKINNMVKYLNVFSYYICSNGAQIIDKNGNEILTIYIDSKIVKQITTIALKNNLTIILTKNKHEITNYKKYTDINNQYRKKFNNNDYKNVLQIRFGIKLNKEFNKIQKFKEQIFKIYGNFIDFGNISSNFVKLNSDSELSWFTINKKNVSKGLSMKILSEYLNIKLINTIVIGNDFNDISMLKIGGISICYKNEYIKNNNIIFKYYVENSKKLIQILNKIYNNIKREEQIKMEKKIGKIDDETFGLKNKRMIKPTIRIGARGIVLNDKGEIAIFNKQNKNEFKLPGGGVEDGETPEEGFLREVIEEVGCDVEIISKLGFIIENKTQNNFRQKSYVFVSKVTNDRGYLSLTEKENDEGAKLIWTTPENGYKLINDCLNKVIGSKYDDTYKTKFMVKRDAYILEYYLQNKNL